jgi:hypothetical protein
MGSEDHSRWLGSGEYFASKRMLLELGIPIQPSWKRYFASEYFYVPGDEWRKLIHAESLQKEKGMEG